MAPFSLLLIALALAIPLWVLFQIVALRHKNEQLERRLRELERAFNNAHDPLLTAARRPTPAEQSFREFGAAVPPPASPAREVDSEPRGVRPPAAGAEVGWEQFTGAKLLAWAGGLAAFLGAAFFVKYSFEHDLIPPALRVTIGYVFALALIIGGLRVPQPRYVVTAQTLCATGVVCLYAVTYACNSLYHFPFFGPGATFVIMALITAAAFALAVRLQAQVVAVLGLLGGFLTPGLLATGHDNAFERFGYIAVLDAGLIALALHQGWRLLVPLGAIGTVAMQVWWAAEFLWPATASTGMLVCLTFCGLFLTAYAVARQRARGEATTQSGDVAPHFVWAATLFPFVAWAFAARLMAYPTVTSAPNGVFAFAFTASGCLLALAAWHRDPRRPVDIGGWLMAGALLGVAAIEYAWHLRYFKPQRATTALSWYSFVYVTFALYPFGLRQRFERSSGVWVVAALAGIVQFPIVYALFRETWRNDVMGLVPLAFTPIPIASIVALRRMPPAQDDVEARVQTTRLVMLSYVALFFVTVSFPIQFERQWITVGWALEGAALLWASIWKRLRAGRHAALAVFGLALLKLFFHDLENLGALHRIGVLFAVAAIAIGASVAYQRFAPSDNEAR
jgi:uncharacterized membrane protein